MDLVTALRTRGGVARRATLMRDGVSRAAIDRALASGAVAKRMGMIAFGHVPDAVVASTAFGAFATCLTLCERAGLSVPRGETRLHLAAGKNAGVHPSARRPTEGIVFHRGVNSHDLIEAIDAAHSCTTPVQQLILLDGALSKRRIDSDDTLRLAHTPLKRRRWLQSHCSPLAKSALETIAGLELSRAGIAFRRQVHVDGVGHVDFMIGERLVIETDGAEFHASPEAQAEDARRARALALAGYMLLTFTYRDVAMNPAGFVATVRAALAKLARDSARS